jgi:hypothetical protein
LPVRKSVPAVEVIETGDLDPQTARMFFEDSPEAEQEWIESLLTIPNEHGNIVDMKLFPQQVRMLNERTGRDITVKGRQTRASSLIIARDLRQMTTRFGLNCLVMTQDDQTTAAFRERIKHHLRDLTLHGWQYDTKESKDNDNELVIGGLENRYIFTSGQQKVAGRAQALQLVHMSELSHYPYQETARSLIGAITPAVPAYPFGQFDIESTPNGAEDVFYDYVMASRPIDPTARWTTRFYPWWLEPRYTTGTTVDCDRRMTEREFEAALQTFTPDPWEERLQRDFGVTVPQLLWRRMMKKDLAQTGVPFEQEFPETLETCFVARGDNYFATQDTIDYLGLLRQECRQPLFIKESLLYKSGEVSFFGPNLRIWEPPQPGMPYVGWVDCAGGGLDEQADFSVLTVINARTKRHVATLRLRTGPQEIARMAVAVMTYYNTGLLGGERDAFGSLAVKTIRELQYPKMWYFVDPSKPRPKTIEPWAHPTQIRDRILLNFRTLVTTGSFLTRDQQAVIEMGAFTWQKTRGRETLKAAGKGQKDDIVMSLAGACFIADIVGGSAARLSESRKQDTLIVDGSGRVIGRQGGRPVENWLR